jgi:hypothetical protein
MADVLIQAPDLGLNSLLPVNMLNPREAADGSYNLTYGKGVLRTEAGLAHRQQKTQTQGDIDV